MNRQLRIRTLGTALLMTAALTLPGAARAAGDPSVVHVDGYLTNQGNRCLILREHDGKTYGLVGAVGGLQTGDHVRLEGRFAGGGSCGGGTAVNVTDVQAIWADDNHRTTYYDHLQNGGFSQWASANRGYNSQRGGDSRGGYDRNRGNDDRNGNGNYRDRNGNYDRNGGNYDRNGGDDRNGSNGNYRDRSGNYDRNGGYNDRSGNLRSISGRVEGYRGDCLIVRGTNGLYYGLAGDMRGNDRRGERVKVLGFLGRGACGDRTVEVQEIR
jgi:hypothetical protein